MKVIAGDLSHIEAAGCSFINLMAHHVQKCRMLHCLLLALSDRLASIAGARRTAVFNFDKYKHRSFPGDNINFTGPGAEISFQNSPSMALQTPADGVFSVFADFSFIHSLHKMRDECPPVDITGPHFFYFSNMTGCPVSFILCKAVSGIHTVQIRHHTIPCHLGDHGGGRD